MKKKRGNPWLLSVNAWIAMLIAGVVQFLIFFSTPFSGTSLPKGPEEQASFVVYPEGKENNYQRLLEEQAWLMDTAPVFLSTSWNYAPELESIIQEATEATVPLFDAFEPSITLNKEAFPDEIALPTPFIRNSLEMLSQDFWGFFSGFGQKYQNVQPLPERSGHCRIIALDSGLERERFLPASLTDSLSMPPFNPVTFLIYVEEGSLLGLPLLLKASGSDAVDRNLRKFVEQELLHGLGLESGYYRIVIGP